MDQDRCKFILVAVLAVLITEEFKDGTIDQFSHDTNLFYFNTLNGVALGLIVQVTISFVTIRGKFMDKKTLQIIFCSVLTFNHVTNKLFQNLKVIICIEKKASSNFLMLAHIKLYNHDLDSNLQNKDEYTMASSPLSFSSKIYASALDRSVYDMEEIFHQLCLTLPVYQTCVKESRDEL